MPLVPAGSWRKRLADAPALVCSISVVEYGGLKNGLREQDDGIVC